LEISKGAVVETSPHLRLPLGIAPCDGGLKARFPRGGKDGHYLEGQAPLDDTSHGTGMLMRSLTAGGNIKLGKRRQSPSAPMLYHRFQGRLGGDGRHGLGGHAPAMQRDTGEDLSTGVPLRWPGLRRRRSDRSQRLARLARADTNPAAGDDGAGVGARRARRGGPGGITWSAPREATKVHAANARNITAAPDSPRSLCSFNSCRTHRTNSSRVTVHVVLCLQFQ